MGLLSRVLPGPKRRFANEVIAGLRQAGAEQIAFDEGEFSLSFVDPLGTGGTVALEPGYHRWVSDPAARAALIQELAELAGRASRVDRWAEVVTMLRPVLRRAGFGHDPHDVTLPAAISRPAMPFLREFVAIDRPGHITFVTGPTVAAWGVTADEVFAAARENLADRARWDVSGPADPDLVLTLAEDCPSYTAAKLLLHGWLAGYAARFGGTPMVFIPDRETVVLAARSLTTLPAFLEMVEAEYRASRRPLSPMAYTVDDHGFVVPFTVPRDHPAWPAVHRAQTILAADEYNAQCDFLSASHEASRTDIHVGPLYVRESDDRAITSMGAWSPGEPSWLPVADYVAVTSPGGGHLAVPWAAFVAIVRPTEVVDLDPIRYAVSDVTADAAAGLRAAAVRL
jgi:hypothetical protein